MSEKVDRELVLRYVVLQNLFAMLQKNGAELGFMRTLLERAYAMAGRVIDDWVLEDIKINRAELESRGIKVRKEEHSGSIVNYHFTCRGYNDQLGISKDVLKSEISKCLTSYISKLGQALKEVRQHAGRP